MSLELDYLRDAERVTSITTHTSAPDAGGPFVMVRLSSGRIVCPDLPDAEGFERALCDLVQAHLGLSETPTRGRPPALDMGADELARLVRAAHDTNQTHAGLAEALGVSDVTLRATRRRLGVSWT